MIYKVKIYRNLDATMTDLIGVFRATDLNNLLSAICLGISERPPYDIFTINEIEETYISNIKEVPAIIRDYVSNIKEVPASIRDFVKYSHITGSEYKVSEYPTREYKKSIHDSIEKKLNDVEAFIALNFKYEVI